MSGSYLFGPFLLDTGDRQLRRDGEPLELNSRYLDALTLLVREQGRLVSKNRFHDEVWRGIPVTDEALTQCIRTLRRQLGDDASRPTFIETVPKHGYRFIAPVETGGDGQARPAVHAPPQSFSWRELLLLGVAGTVGAGLAGLLGGLFYGLAAAAQPLQPGLGSISILLVLVCVTVLIALIGGAGVSFGVALAQCAKQRGWFWAALGGATGGLFVGALAKLLGLDAFNLLVGQSPGDITGGAEGALLGGAIGFGIWIGNHGVARPSARRSALAAGMAGAAAGLVIPLLGGRLLGGSLDLLASPFPNSRLRLDQIGHALGESGFGPLSQMLTGAMEGLLFGACLAAAMSLARKDMVATPER